MTAPAQPWPALAATLATLPLPVAVVDLETTGGHFEQDRITEVAILRFAHGQVSSHQWLVNPQQPISRFITRLTGISNAMVADAPTFAELAVQLLPLLQGHLLVAHNSRFDYTFLRREFARAGHHFAAPTLCTVQLSRRLYPQHIKHNLDSLIDRFGLDADAAQRHRAMADATALARFLALSLTQHPPEYWLRQWQHLTKPHYLPAWLPENLRQTLYRLPDGPGLTVWHHPGHSAPQVQVHQQAFSNISALLQEPGAADRWQDTRDVAFVPALSLLHAHALKAGHPPTATPRSAAWFTVQFAANHHGQLQARIVSLVNGVQNQRPYGLFAHPRGAKKALAEWARQHRLCPALLDITPQSIARQAPCPLAAAGLCAGHCRDEAETGRHNAAVLQAAPLLPVCDWGQHHVLDITEHDAVTGRSVVLRCVAGAIEVAAGQWYFDDSLPRLFKQRLKQAHGIRALL